MAFTLALTWGKSRFYRRRRERQRVERACAVFLSAVGTGLSRLCYFKALQLGEVSKVAPIDRLSVPLGHDPGGRPAAWA